jgi:hypothetical protein
MGVAWGVEAANGSIYKVHKMHERLYLTASQLRI